jgi:uncharacterized membrane protein
VKARKDNMRRRIRILTTSAIIAALYVVVTVVLGFSSYGPVQIRFSEAMTVLPYFTPVAVPALFVGCLIANIFGGNGIWDITIGSIATLISAYITYKISFNKPKRKLLAPLPPVIVNAVIVGPMLSILYDMPMLVAIGSVAAGELIACYVLGYPLMLIIERNKVFSELYKRFF